MGKLKLKSNVPKNTEPEQNFPIAHTPTRAEEREQRQRDKEFGNYDDIKPYLRRIGGTMVNQTEHLPQGDWQTYNVEEWTKLNEKKSSSYNSRNNASYYWH